MIEDDLLMAEMYRLQLAMDGFQVTVVNDGRTGLEHVRSGRFDAVVLDLGLPGIDGFEVLTTIRSDPEVTAPVVILSNYGDPDLVNQGLALGAVEYLIKSKTAPPELSARIRAMLGQGQMN